MPKEFQTELKQAIGQARSVLEDLQRVGLGEYYPDTETAQLPVCELDQVDGPASCQVQSLDDVRAELGDCQRCELSRERNSIVFGVGNPDADLVLVGEGPGREEDLKGEPFVGEAGGLLTKIIEAIKLKRGDVYICNVLKCRPPENRNPAPEEISNCQDYLKRQISIIRPRVICTLGKFATQALADSLLPISKLRGKFYDYQGIKVMPTFHPAYLLRNPAAKKLVWQDMKKIARELRIKLK